MAKSEIVIYAIRGSKGDYILFSMELPAWLRWIIYAYLLFKFVKK